MEIRNIWRSPVDLYEDDRGKIVDILEGVEIQHVPAFETKRGAVRGNHYRKQGTQYLLVVDGKFEYWYKPADSSEPAEGVIIIPWDLVTIPPMEVQALRAVESGKCIVFSERIRKGQEHENNTVRVKPSIIGEPLEERV